jgi:uncharacterized membrane protein YfcA
MQIDPLVALAGLVVGFVVGLTGMGGGALTTPMLVLLFRVEPLAAVSSDLVAAVVMKPVGGAVHLRSGTVNRRSVLLLALGSVPSAFAGALLLHGLGEGGEAQNVIKYALGIALVAGSAGIGGRILLGSKQAAHRGEALATSAARDAVTVAVGVLGGLIVGLTSVGSGSIMVVLLMMLYPRLSTSELVGTDLVQAIPLVAAAAAGHLLFGDFRLGLTVSLLIGSIPGVYCGARLSSKAGLPFVRPALAVVLLLSGAKLLHASNLELALVFVGAVAFGLTVWRVRRIERAMEWIRSRSWLASRAEVVEAAPDA